MTKRTIFIAFVAVAVVAIVLLAAAPRSDPVIIVERDIVYGKGAETELKLDLAMPKAGEGLLPAVVFLHGEGFADQLRNQKSMQRMPDFLADRIRYAALERPGRVSRN